MDIPSITLFLSQCAIEAWVRIRKINGETWDGFGSGTKNGHRREIESDMKSMGITELPKEQIHLKQWEILRKVNKENEYEGRMGITNIYTDGSKIGDSKIAGAGWSIQFGDYSEKEGIIHIPNGTVFQAEVLTIKEVCEFIKDNNMQHLSFKLWSDSQAALMSLKGKKKVSELVAKCKDSMKDLDIQLEWVKGHANVTGNEYVDYLAKKGTLKVESKIIEIKKSFKLF